MQPEFDLGAPSPPPARVRRNFVGWGLLILFFALVVPRATYKAVTRDPSASKVPAAAELTLKYTMALREAASAGGPAQPSVRDLRTLDDTATALATPGRKDPEAAMTYIAIRDEQGQKYEPVYLDVLRKSHEDTYRAFAEVYGSDKLTPQQAQNLAGRIRGDRFLYRLARAEAAERAGDPAAKKALTPPTLAFGLMFAMVAGGFVVIAGFVLWVVYISLRTQGRFRPLGHPVGRLSLPMADHFAVRAVQLLAIFLLGPLLVRQLGSGLSEAGQNLLSGIVVIGGTLALLAVGKGDDRISPSNLGIEARGLGRRILWAVCGYMADVPAVLAAAGIGLTLFRFLPAPEHPASEMLQKTHDPLAVFALLFLACVQAPVFEEILFRGILFPALSTVLRGPVAGAIASSLLFAAMHPQGPAAWLALATVGGMNCFLTYQTRSLVPAMILHGLHNGVLMALTLTLS